MKRSIKVYGLMLTLALLIVVTVVAVKNQNTETADTQEDTSVTIFTLEDTDVTALSWTWDGETVELEREDELWCYAPDPSFPLDDSQMEVMLSDLTELKADKTIEAPEDLSQYGLEEPAATVTVTTGTEGERQILLGDETGMGGSVYCDVGDGNVYLVDEAVLDDFCYGLYDLVEKETIPAMNDILKVTIQAGTRNLELDYLEDSGLAYSDEYVWFLNQEGSYVTLDTELTESFLGNITDLSWGTCVDYKAQEDLSQYGLEEPAAVVTIDYIETTRQETNETDEDGNTVYETVQEEKSFVLELGSYVDSDCYARLAGSGLVYRVDGAVLDRMLYADWQELLPDDVLLLEEDELESVDVTLNGETRTLYREVRVVEAEEDSAVEASDSAEPETTEETVYLLEDQKVDFGEILDMLAAMTSAGTVDQVPENAQELVSITFHRNTDSWPEVTLAFLQYDSSSCILRLNGETRLLVYRDEAQAVAEALEDLLAE